MRCTYKQSIFLLAGYTPRWYDLKENVSSESKCNENLFLCISLKSIINSHVLTVTKPEVWLYIIPFTIIKSFKIVTLLKYSSYNSLLYSIFRLKPCLFYWTNVGREKLTLNFGSVISRPAKKTKQKKKPQPFSVACASCEQLTYTWKCLVTFYKMATKTTTKMG